MEIQLQLHRATQIPFNSLHWRYATIFLFDPFAFFTPRAYFFAPIPIAFYYWWYLFTVHECTCVCVCVTCQSGTSFMKFTFIATHWQTHKLKTAIQKGSEREREKISRSLLINILVCWFHFVCLRVEVWLTAELGVVEGVWNLHSTCLILFGFATVDTRHSWTNNRGASRTREKHERLREIWENLSKIKINWIFKCHRCCHLLSRSRLHSPSPSFQPHFPFVILHSFCQFLCRSSSLKTNDVIGQFSTLQSCLFTRAATTTTTRVQHNLTFCNTC